MNLAPANTAVYGTSSEQIIGKQAPFISVVILCTAVCHVSFLLYVAFTVRPPSLLNFSYAFVVYPRTEQIM